MNFKNNVLEAIVNTKEADFSKKKDLTNTEHLSNHKAFSFLDGLLNIFDKSPDEISTEKVCTADGYDIRNSDILEEARPFETEIATRNPDTYRPKNYTSQLLFINSGIHPSAAAKDNLWKGVDKQGNVHPFTIVSIEQKDRSQEPLIGIRLMEKRIYSGGIIRPNEKNKKVELVPASKIKRALESPHNEQKYQTIMKQTGDNPEEWLNLLQSASGNMFDSYAKWKEEHALDLEGYSEPIKHKMWKLDQRQWYTFEDLLKRFEKEKPKDTPKPLRGEKMPVTKFGLANKEPDIEESVLVEAEIDKKPNVLRERLRALDIDPIFMTMPAKINYPKTKNPANQKAPDQFIITGIPREPNDMVKEIYISIKNPNLSRRVATKMDINKLKEILSRPENSKYSPETFEKDTDKNEIGVEIDQNDWDSFHGTKSVSLNPGTVGEGRDLTQQHVLAALQYVMDNVDEFKDLDLIEYYNRSLLTGKPNGLILNALKAVDQNMGVRAVPDKHSKLGIKYQVVEPFTDAKKSTKMQYFGKDRYKDTIEWAF